MNKTELERLKDRNSFLEEVVLDQKITIEALLMGCTEIGLNGSTEVITYIAQLESKLKEIDPPTNAAIDSAIRSGMLKSAGKNLVEYFDSLHEHKAMLVIPHDPSEGKGYTVRSIDINKIEDAQ